MTRMNQAGFTLPELLVTGGVLVVLVVLASFFLHPQDYSAADRNSQRRLDIAALLQATRAYKADKGDLPPSITTKTQLIGSATNASHLCADLVPGYLNAMPRDPLLGKPATVSSCNQKNASYTTGFTVIRTKDGQHVMFAALLSEDGAQVSANF